LEANARIEALDLVTGDLEREVDIAIAPCKARVRDANDGVVLAHQLDRLAHHGWFSVVVPLPELVSQHNDRLRILSIDRIGGHQSAPQRWGNSEKVEAVGAEINALNAFGQIRAGNGQVPVVFDEGIFHNRRFTQLLPLRTRHTKAIEVA